MDDRIRILIVDDHAVVREGLVSMLSQFDEFEIVGTAQDGREGLAAAASLAPDVVLLDLEMPEMHGLDVLAQLTEREGERPRVIVLTVHDDDDLVLRAVRGGADGYVLKHVSQEELAAAIKRVAAGGRSFDDVVVSAFLKERQIEEERSRLSAREVEVLQLVADGFSNKEIAQHLFLGLATVKTHLNEVYRKLEVSDRAHAVAVALRSGIIDRREGDGRPPGR